MGLYFEWQYARMINLSHTSTGNWNRVEKSEKSQPPLTPERTSAQRILLIFQCFSYAWATNPSRRKSFPTHVLVATGQFTDEACPRGIIMCFYRTDCSAEVCFRSRPLSSPTLALTPKHSPIRPRVIEASPRQSREQSQGQSE